MSKSVGIARRSSVASFDGRLLFSKVREDPEIERGLLQPERRGRLVVVGSGGCTALSLLSQGECEIVAVDSNRTQCHLVELKAATLAELEPKTAVGFLGGHPMPKRERALLAPQVARRLGPEARAFWGRHVDWIDQGVLRRGVTERFIGSIRWLLNSFVQSRRSIQRLLGARSLAEQHELYDASWNNRRWRMLFHVLLNRWVLRNLLDERLFLRQERGSVAGYFLERFEHGICRIPAATNYFLHHMLTGWYAQDSSAALPPYLASSPSNEALAERLQIVDGSMTGYLAACPSDSVRGFALSNICEWMQDGELRDLLNQVARVATDGARVVCRNFLGFTELPRGHVGLVKDEGVDTEQLIGAERSLMQRRVLVFRVDKSKVHQTRSGLGARERHG